MLVIEAKKTFLSVLYFFAFFDRSCQVDCKYDFYLFLFSLSFLSFKLFLLTQRLRTLSSNDFGAGQFFRKCPGVF